MNFETMDPKAMDMLERYLQAVGQFLPVATRGDTIAELRANLLDQMDARAEELGRSLNELDMAEALKAHGKPELVALRYLPQRSLIGPTVFPFYLFTLKRVTPLVVLGSAIARGVLFVSSRHESIAQALVDFAFGLIPSLLITAAIITVIFALIEREVSCGHVLARWNQWDPMKLPPVKSHEPGAKSKSMPMRVMELGVHCLWMAYVLVIPTHPFWLIGPGVFYFDSLNVKFAPIWHVFYELLIVMLVVQLVMKVLALLPDTDHWTKPTELAVGALGIIALAIVASTQQPLLPAGPNVDLKQLMAVNYGVGLAIKICLLFSIVGLAVEGWKWIRRTGPAKALAF